MAPSLHEHGLPGQRFPRHSLVLIFLGFVGLSIVWFSPAWTAPTTRWVGIGGDALDAMWYFAWIPHAILLGHNPLFTTAINYPRGVNLAWDASMPLLAVIAWPITATLGPIFAYNLCMTVGLAAAGLTTAILVRRYVRSSAVAIAAGAAFMGTPYFAGQALEHVFLIAVPLVPVAAIWFDWAIVHTRGRPRTAGLLLGTIIGLEFLMSEELAASCSLLLVLTLAWLAILDFHALTRSYFGRLLRIGLWSGVAVALLDGWVMWWQLAGPDRIRGVILTPASFSASVIQLLLPGPAQALFIPETLRWLAGPSYNPVSTGAYLGPLVLGAALITVSALWHSRTVRLLAALAGTIALLALGPILHITAHFIAGPLPDAPLWRIPLAGDLLPLHFTLYLDLIIVLIMAIGLDRLLRTRWSRVAWPVAALILLSWAPVFPYPDNAPPVPTAFLHRWRPDGQVLLVVPFAQNVLTARPMEWQTTSAFTFSMVDGYYTRSSGPRPWNYGPRLNPLTWDLWTLENGNTPPYSLAPGTLSFRPSAHWLTPMNAHRPGAIPIVGPTLRHFVANYLTDHAVTDVVLGPTADHAAVERFLISLLGPATSRGQGLEQWHRSRAGWSARVPFV